jgi:hypothetical protein
MEREINEDNEILIFDPSLGKHIVQNIDSIVVHEEYNRRESGRKHRKIASIARRNKKVKVIDVTKPHLKQFHKVSVKDVGKTEPINIGSINNG